ncbi:MAG: hypothetical protein JRG73_20825 [Deltaproteobacteria bacterium]|nr:hypothetical protein [Deltaproteobacteria bacterium]MBW2309372.1 hypothetical protein [Deltaproteobacteria bacterium]
MKKSVAWFIPIVLLIGVLTAAPASSQCVLDMSGATGSFGFDGTTNTLYISNIQFLGTAFTINWTLNLSNGNWRIHGSGGSASGTGGLIDFSDAVADFSGCVTLLIRNFQFLGQAFTACWNLDMTNGDWILAGIDDQCDGGQPSDGQTSTVSVCVTDAATGGAIADAFVSFDNLSGTTGTDGCVSFNDVPYGSYALTASAENCGSTTRSETINQPTQEILVALSCDLGQGEYRIVLTWGQTPRDLDSHLLVPGDSNNSGYHVYFGLRGSQDEYPWAWLDRDDVTGSGPETITIFQPLSGTYRYYVHLYCCESQALLTASRANVTLFRGENQLGSWNVPTSGDGRYWHVFDLNAETGDVTTSGAGIRSTAPSAP